MLASFLLLSIEIEHTHTHLQLIRRYSLYLYYSSTSFLRLETKCLSVITCKKKSCSYMDGNGFRQRYVLLAYRQIEIDIDRQIDSEQTNIKSDRYYLLTKLQSKQMVQNNIGYGLLHFVYESNLDVCLMILMMLHLSIEGKNNNNNFSLSAYYQFFKLLVKEQVLQEALYFYRWWQQCLFYQYNNTACRWMVKIASSNVQY